jgi:hypothetical protein
MKTNLEKKRVEK